MSAVGAGSLDVHAVLRRDARFALDVRLRAEPGITWLLGPSGAGKTTLLRVVAGLERPDGGHVRVGDVAWFDGQRALPVEARRVGFVPQSMALFPHLTARANIAFGVDPADPAAMLRAAQRFRVEAFLDRMPRTLSGGEAQRVAIARAVARRPAVLLLDEPFSALDEELAVELAGEVLRYTEEEGIVTICASHRHGVHAALPGARWVMRSGVARALADENR